MDRADEFLLVIEDDGPDVVISFVGQMDFSTLAVLRDSLDELSGRPVTLDVANVTLIDDSALWVLATALRRARASGTELTLRGMRDDQLSILNRTGLDEILAASAPATT